MEPTQMAAAARRHRDADRDEFNRKQREGWAKGSKVKQRARRQVSYALQRGRLSKPTHCPECERPTEPGEMQAHHEDYSRPLAVTWACRQCHMRGHRKHLTGAAPVQPLAEWMLSLLNRAA